MEFVEFTKYSNEWRECHELHEFNRNYCLNIFIIKSKIYLLFVELDILGHIYR